VSLLSLCGQTATIYDKTTAASSSSNLGGHVVTRAALFTDIPVTIQPKKSYTVEEHARRGIQTNYTAYTPTDISSVSTGYTLVCGGVTYLIVGWGDMAGKSRGWFLDLLRKQ
jgi:hypothetical protein